MIKIALQMTCQLFSKEFACCLIEFQISRLSLNTTMEKS